jgi:hypothetical protein
VRDYRAAPTPDTGGRAARRARPWILAALAGLIVCAALAAGLVELARQPSANPTAPAPATFSTDSPEASASPTSGGTASPTPGVPMAIGSIDWQTGEKLPNMGLLQGALGLDDEVLAFGDTHIPGRVAGYGVGAIWSSTDGLTWKLVTGPDTFSRVGSGILRASSDGHGGVFAAGFVYSDSENYVSSAVWHSRDGLAWTPVDIGSPKRGPGGTSCR